MKKKILLLLASATLLAGCSGPDAPAESSNASSIDDPSSLFVSSENLPSSSNSEAPSLEPSSEDQPSVSEDVPSSETVSEDVSGSEASSEPDSSSEPAPAAGWASIQNERLYSMLDKLLTDYDAGGLASFPFMDVPEGTEWSYDEGSTASMVGAVALTGGNRNNNALIISQYKDKLREVGFANPTEDELSEYISDYYDIVYNSKAIDNIFVLGESGLMMELLDIGSTDFDEYFKPVVPDGVDAGESGYFTEGIMIAVQVIKTF